MRRLLAVAWVVGLALALNVTSAFAWENGQPRDAFGTHDWILYQAIELAGADASWIDEREALMSTDDPDNWRDDYPHSSAQYRLEQPLHLYYPDSTKQGAPQAVTDHYALMVRALSAEDTATASRELGYLSHYYSDLLVPFHTWSYGGGSLEEGIDHREYESAMGAITQSPNAHAQWIAPLTPRPMTDVRARSIEAARLSGDRMLDLIAKYGTLEKYDPTADAESQRLINRAVNDLADVIRSAKSGSGMPRPIASIQTWAVYYNPALRRPARVLARVKDDQGRVVRGVKVNYDFRVAQPCSYTSYTDGDGVAGQTHDTVLGALNVPFNVVVTAASAGTTLTSVVALTPTEVIGRGAAGISTYTKYDATPAQGTTVTVKTHIENDHDEPIAGIRVVYTFKHKGVWLKRTAYTNSGGNAWYSRNIGNSRAGYRVYVRADAYGGTEPDNTYDGIRSDTTSFVPHGSVAAFKAFRRTPAKPSQSTTVTIRAECLDDHGDPLVGRTVKFAWKHKSGTVYTTAKTNAYGNAYVSRNIGKAKIGYKVDVAAYIKSGSKVKTSVVSFTPQSR